MATERIKGVKGAPRTELVAVRFDPQTRYLMEIAARAQHRSVANYVERAVEESFSRAVILTNHKTGDETTIEDVRTWLYDDQEPDRMCKLGGSFPTLLMPEERAIWKLVLEIQQLDPLARGDEHAGPHTISLTELGRVRDNWELYKAAASGRFSASRLLAAIGGDKGAAREIIAGSTKISMREVFEKAKAPVNKRSVQ